MLRSDLETAEAFARLSVPDLDPAGMNRRRFLQAVALGLGGGAVLSAAEAALVPTLLPDELRSAWSAPPVGPNEGIVVVVFMLGGNDGLNTLVPYTDANYYGYRGGLAVPPDQVLAINGSVGLHPNLRFMKQMYDDGRVAIVQGVGYPNPDFSHFSSMGIWMKGSAVGGAATSGWIGRWLDGFSTDDAFRAATIGTSVPLHMVGNVRRATGVPRDGGGFGTADDAQDIRLYDAIREFSAAGAGRGVWHDAIAATERVQLEVASTTIPLFTQPLPEDKISGKLVLAARLINANLGLRVLDVGWGDFDSHSNQPSMHPSRMSELDTALRLFFTNLDDAYRSRVSVLVVSEFGRTPWANGSAGTDHGAGSVAFLVGHSVAGGLHGQYPSLANKRRWDQLDHHVDFRQMYASILGTWLGGDPTTVLGAAYGGLNLYASGPGAELPEAPAPPNLAGDYVPLNPFRVLDTRNNIGGRRVPLGAGTTVEIAAAGVGGVPSTGVTAVALNVTATGPTTESYFTIWPKGDARPIASSLNWSPGKTVPNLVVMKPGTGGKVNVWNESGEVHAIADVVGYFRDTGADRLLPVSPFRLLDTRNGIGAPLGPVGEGATLELQATGVAGSGVPADGIDAVVLNVTVDQPTTESYLTVWPSGEPFPTASSLNFTAGQTVPNLVISKVGAGGRVSFFNAFGSAHVLADVVGCFSSTALGRHHAVGPTRILDTRNGIGSSGKVTNTTLRLPVAGLAGVPGSGASGVVMNVTITGPSAESFLTVWPSGEGMPTASSLNYTAGLTVANLVIVKLGGDGAVNLANAFGDTHVIADVVGYFA